MSDKMNVGEYLYKLSYQEDVDGEVVIISKKDLLEAIKEIVEAVIDQCAEEAKTVNIDSCTGEEYRYGAPSGYDVHEAVDKESILQIKQIVNYE
jgi:hypothetical protein